MSDERPARPQYGEYATPEEVAAALGTPAPPAPESRLDAPAAPAPSAPPSASTPHPPLTPARRSWDAPITVALLALGLWNVLGSIAAFWQFDLALAEAFAATPNAPEGLEPGEPTLIAGRVLLGLWLLLYAGAVVLSVRRLQARRPAAWLALVAGVAAMLAIVVVITVLIVVDPGLAPLLQPATG